MKYATERMNIYPEAPQGWKITEIYFTAVERYQSQWQAYIVFDKITGKQIPLKDGCRMNLFIYHACELKEDFRQKWKNNSCYPVQPQYLPEHKTNASVSLSSARRVLFSW